MSELDAAILAKIQESAVKINDYDQRSALGMARTWIDKAKLDTWNPERHKDMIEVPNRDQLAKDLVAILETSDDVDEMVGALAGARAWVNAPFIDSSMLGQRSALLKPKEKKKGEK